MSRTLWPMLAAVFLTACAQPTPEQQIVNDAAAALGGREQDSGRQDARPRRRGINGNLGQDMTPDATGPSLHASRTTSAPSTSPADASAIEQTRTPNFTFFQGQQPQKQVLGVDGDVAYNVAANGNATRAGEAVAKDRRAESYHHPITIVRAALDPAAMLSNPRTQDNQSVVDITTADGLMFTLAIDEHDEAADPRRLDDRQHEPRRRRDRDELRRLSGCQRAQAAGRLTTKTDRFTDRGSAGDETDGRCRHRRSGGAGRRGIAAASPDRRRRWSPSRKSRRASGGSPAAAITASSSSSRTT